MKQEMSAQDGAGATGHGPQGPLLGTPTPEGCSLNAQLPTCYMVLPSEFKTFRGNNTVMSSR